MDSSFHCPMVLCVHVFLSQCLLLAFCDRVPYSFFPVPDEVLFLFVVDSLCGGGIQCLVFDKIPVSSKNDSLCSLCIFLDVVDQGCADRPMVGGGGGRHIHKSYSQLMSRPFQRQTDHAAHAFPCHCAGVEVNWCSALPMRPDPNCCTSSSAVLAIIVPTCFPCCLSVAIE